MRAEAPVEVLAQLFHTKFSSGLQEETLFIGNAQETPSTLGTICSQAGPGLLGSRVFLTSHLPS